MFHKKIETQEDALEFIQKGKTSKDILDRLEMLDSLIDSETQTEPSITN
jgi:hypothetical protein